jgi:hypothetical protein
MSGSVSSLYTNNIANKATGDVNIVSTQPSLLVVSNTGSNVSFAPASGAVATLQSIGGDITLTSTGNTITITQPALTANINLEATGGGGNWSYKGAWVASNAYVVNDVVFDSDVGASDATNIGYIASSNIPASSNAPYTSAGQTAGWMPYFNNLLVGFNNGSNASDPSYTTAISMAGVSGSPPPVNPGSNGDQIFVALNNDGNLYGDFGAGRFVVAGINSGLSPSGSNTLPFITTTGNAGSNIQMSVNGGGALPVNIVGGLTVNGVPVATGGNWSWRGAFNTTVATAYALNDVVFDSVNTTQTYICILAYTTTVPTPTAPSADATHWLLFATQGGAGGSSITNGGATLGINATGGLTFTTTDTASNTNNINITTIVPTTTPGSNAGQISINSGSNIALTSVDDTTITSSGATSQITLTAPGKVNLLTVSTGNIVAGATTAQYSQGKVLFNTDAWNDQAGYIPGSVVQESGVSYVALNNIVPNAVSPYNPAPSATPVDWLPLGGSAGGGITGIEINGGTAYPTSGNTINFQPGNGIVMSNSGSNIIAISASPQGSGAYLTNNSNTWEWLGSNSYTATEGVVSYQGGLYANILAPSSNVPPFGASNSTTLWAGLAPSLSIGLSNISPLQPSASNAYTYSLVQGSNSNISITSPATGQIALDANIGFSYPGGSGPIVGPAGLFSLQSSTSNILITSPSAGVIDLNVDAPAMNYASLWTASGVYEIDDVVYWGGFNWICLVATTAGQSPQTTPASWRELGAVPTGLTSVLPAGMVAGVIPQNTLNGANAVDVWASSNVYMRGNTVVSDTTGRMYQSITNTNTSNNPATDPPGSNWSFAGIAPQFQNNLIAYGSNVSANAFTGTPANGAIDFFDFLPVNTALSPSMANAGGVHMTYNGGVTVSWVGNSNANPIIGCQLFDSGSSNVDSFSAPYYLLSNIPIVGGGSGSATFDVNLSIITPVNSNAVPTYSLGVLFGNAGGPSGGVNGGGGSLTGCASYIFSGQTANFSF